MYYYKIGLEKHLEKLDYTVFRKKTPTHIFFHISMCDV